MRKRRRWRRNPLNLLILGAIIIQEGIEITWRTYIEDPIANKIDAWLHAEEEETMPWFILIYVWIGDGIRRLLRRPIEDHME